MSMNKKMMVVGCSFSTGEECCDEELFENYWDFHKDPTFVGAEGKPGVSRDKHWQEKNLKHAKYHEEMRTKLIPEWAERPDVQQLIKEKIERDNGPTFPDMPEGQRRDWVPYWQWYNDRHCYSQVLQDKTEYDVVNASRRGTGINYQHLIYNIHRQIKTTNKEGLWWNSAGHWPNVYVPEKQFSKSWYLQCYYPKEAGIQRAVHGYPAPNWAFNELKFCGKERDPNFRYDEYMDSADVLIWQFTGEPRYAVTLRDRDEIAIGSSLEQLDNWFEHYYKFLPGGEKHIPEPSGYRLADIPGKDEIREWYKYYHDPASDIAKSVGWMQNIVKLREAKGLKTILMVMTSQFSKRYGIQPRNNEHTRSIGFDYDIKMDNEDVVNMYRKDPNVNFQHHTEDGLTYTGLKRLRTDPHTKAKFGHLTKEGHWYVAHEIMEILEEWK